MLGTRRRWVIAVGALLSATAVLEVGAHDIASNVPSEAVKRANPLARSEAVIAAGQDVYEKACASCHGPSGRGDTPAASAFSHRPSDFTKGFKGQSDGVLFWKITKGGGPMPAYEKTLPEEQRWQVIHYLRTLENPAAGMRP